MEELSHYRSIISCSPVNPDRLMNVIVVACPDELLHVDPGRGPGLALVVRVLVEHDLVFNLTRAVGGATAGAPKQVVEGGEGAGLGTGCGYMILILQRVKK